MRTAAAAAYSGYSSPARLGAFSVALGADAVLAGEGRLGGAQFLVNGGEFVVQICGGAEVGNQPEQVVAVARVLEALVFLVVAPLVVLFGASVPGRC
ncbi:hypothetical protein [Streptomyces sp. 769]|uniref:hypothetical protein n=1 Tax=Streptomyces sp. 769 TaxID=1262452 RepID=UPI00058A26CF|nr:hypothetical protein [Streptomyces sp. 769]